MPIAAGLYKRFIVKSCDIYQKTVSKIRKSDGVESRGPKVRYGIYLQTP